MPSPNDFAYMQLFGPDLCDKMYDRETRNNLDPASLLQTAISISLDN